MHNHGWRGFRIVCLPFLLLGAACQADPPEIPYVPWDGGTPDAGIEGEIVLSVPPGATLCTSYSEAHSWDQAVALMGSVSLRPGHYVVPLKAGRYRSGIIGEVLFGPDRIRPEPVSDELLEVVGTGDQVRFEFIRDYSLLGSSYQVEVGTWFLWICPVDITTAEIVTMDREALWGCAYAVGRRQATDEKQSFSSCEPPENQRYLIEGGTASGDHVLLDVRRVLECSWVGHAECLTLYRAEVGIGGEERTVTDPFGLVYTAGHHNCDQEFVVLFDEPVGEVAALHVVEPDLDDLACIPDPDPDPGWFVRRDAGLNEIAREAITAWTVLERPPEEW